MAHRQQQRVHRSENFNTSQTDVTVQSNWPLAVAGGVLTLIGLRKITSLQGLVLSAVGGAIVYQALGCARFGADCGELSERPDPLVEKDPIDEASWESFPASDSPSFSPGRA